MKAYCAVLILVCINLPASATDLGKEIEDLCQRLHISAPYSVHIPEFRVQAKDIQFARAKGGTEYRRIWFITDQEHHVALYVPGQKPYLDVIAGPLEQAPDTLVMPVRYHNATLFGTRLTTSLWLDAWRITGSEHDFKFRVTDSTVVLEEWQRWSRASGAKRDGFSHHRFTFAVDDRFGYVVRIDCHFESDENSITDPEFINFMPPDVWNPWPGESKYAYTVYAPGNEPGYRKFAHNLVAADLSDNHKQAWGKGFSIRDQGFVATLDSAAWSPALMHYGSFLFIQRTCDVWIDQHNHVRIPPPNDKGKFRCDPSFVFCHFPPKLSTYLLKQAKPHPLPRENAVMIAVGETEDFESQPKPLTQSHQGPVRAWWLEDLKISREQCRSGHQSLKVNGITLQQLQKNWKINYLHAPNIHLDDHSTYELSAWVRVEGDNTFAFIMADLYEWTIHNPERLVVQRTDTSALEQWQIISLRFETGEWDPSVDLRFMVIGEGHAYFDDFVFKKY